MRVPPRACVLALLLTMATACSQPRNAPTVVRPDAAVPAISGAAAPAGGTNVGVDADLIKEGYRVQRRHDQILYCRSQSVTGTLFASTVCLTASQIASQKRELQQSRDLLNQGHATTCVGPECVGK